ncbi:hypothetical protein Taro_043510 [Colocasia esculenta]|uniref:Small RNA 2'-O-methyltransferase n=1 Tax=Colocasia esculenta TaxID=4460 RepID=A0A843X0U5_COLES|nr:hypothetical protein [Colocasia esculenta]
MLWKQGKEETQGAAFCCLSVPRLTPAVFLLCTLRASRESFKGCHIIMREAQGMPNVVVGKPPLSAKALLHQKYGDKACYKVEEVLEPVENECPGLVIPQRGRVLYQCHLEIPGCSVTSEKFTKKKDAEQAAAKMALEKPAAPPPPRGYYTRKGNNNAAAANFPKLGIQSMPKDLTPEEAWDELIMRVSSLFTDKFIFSIHPMVGHIREAIKREDDGCGMVPVSIIAACDVKINNLCKLVNPKAESEPLLAMSLVIKAARLLDSVCISKEGLSIGKKGPYSSDALQSLMNNSMQPTNHALIEALYIPSSMENPIETFNLEVSPSHYYMDGICQKLGVKDSSHVLVSRTVGKASSETRFYFSSPRSRFSLSSPVSSQDTLPFVEGFSFSALISPLTHIMIIIPLSLGPPVDLLMLLGLTPDGCHKLSREAILAAELPSSFTTKSNWRGLCPRDLLSMFCRHHRLLEPHFSVKEIASSGLVSQTLRCCEHLELPKSTVGIDLSNGKDSNMIEGESERSVTFICEVKILSKGQDLIIEYLGENYKKQPDAIQNAALTVLSWLNKYFQHLDMPIEELSLFGSAHKIHVYPERFSQVFASCFAVHGIRKREAFSISSPVTSLSMMQSNRSEENEFTHLIYGDPETGNFPSPGSLVCISYTVALVKKEECIRETIERKEEFEFELGTGAVIDQIEVCVSQMSLGQSAQLIVELPSRELILAAAGHSAKCLSQMSLQDCLLEYSLELLQITEPAEDRMEQALFSPPLSKQRVEFAVGMINNTHSASLVDFGCGSGSLLDSLLEHPTTLEKIIGVDISRKGLSRAAKILHTKLTMNSGHSMQRTIKSVVLYDGSITDYDTRVYGIDIGTCLEVIEHMEEDQASLFGDVALSLFSPRLLIISTPNYEYNSILQRTISPNKEDDLEDKSHSAPCRFRNHDHKFEWTRKQFELWATELAARHCYSVEFTGVGGSANIEPGFASQIAVFRRGLSHQAEMCSINEIVQPYEVVWEWSSLSRSDA